MRYYGMSSQGTKRTENAETAKSPNSEETAKAAYANGLLNPKSQSEFENNRWQSAAETATAATAAETAAEAEDAATLHALRQTGAAARQETESLPHGNMRLENKQSQNAKTESAPRGGFQAENAQPQSSGAENEPLARWLENQPRAIFPPTESDINIRLPQQNRFEIGAGVGIGNSGDGAEREEEYPLNKNGYSESREKNDYIRNIGDIDLRGAEQSRSAASICPIADKNDEYLCRAAGKFVKVEFLGGAPSSEKSGILKYAGNDYIVIEEGGSRNSVMCAMKNINTVTVYG